MVFFSLLEMSVKYRKSRIELWLWMRDVRLNLLILMEKFYFLKSKEYMIKLRYEGWRKLILEILKKSVVDSIKHNN